MKSTITLVLVIFGYPWFVNANPPLTMNYQGRIFDEHGSPLEVNHVNFTVEILSPPGNCVIYKEFHEEIPFINKNGTFSLGIGKGEQAANGFPGNIELNEILSNNRGPIDCLHGGTYTPNPGDHRRLRVRFNYMGSGGDILVTGDIFLRSVPYALYAGDASSVQGIDGESILIENTSAGGQLTRENLSAVFDATSYPILRDLLDGVSNLYLKPGATGAIDAGGQRISNLDEPTGAQDAATKNYVDTQMGSTIGGHNVAPDFDELGAAEDGQFLRWNGTQNQWEVAGIDVDLTGALLTDGTVAMEADLNLDGNNITHVDNIAAASGSFGETVTAQTGVFTESFIGDPAVVGSGLKMRAPIDMNGADHLGVSTGPHKIINLATPTNPLDAVTKAYADGRLAGRELTAPTADEDGQALVWDQASGEWHYSALSAGSVTSITAGTGLDGGTITDIGTISIANGGVGTTQLADDAVTNVKIADNAISTAHIFAPVPTQTRIVAATGATGAQLAPLTCTVDGEILKWTAANGWACAEDEEGAGGGGSGDFMADGSVAMTGAIRAPNGTPGAPSYSFGASTNTGMFSEGPGTIVFSTSGHKAGDITTQFVNFYRPIRGFNGTTPTNVQYAIGMDDDTGMYSSAANTLQFSTAGSERLRIASNGAVGIGTTNTSTARLSINSSNSGIYVFNNNSHWGLQMTSGAASNGLNIGSFTDGTKISTMYDEDITFYNNNGIDPLLTIKAGGAVGIGTIGPSEKLDVDGNVRAVSFVSTSDRRLKTNIEDVDGLELIRRLRGVRFDWIKDGSSEVGLIAQEVEEVAPELVNTSSATGIKSVKYSNLVAPLIESTKDLYEMCSIQEERIGEVESSLNSLTRELASKADQAEVEELRVEVNTLNSENLRVVEELSQLKQENEALKLQIQEIYNMLKN